MEWRILCFIGLSALKSKQVLIEAKKKSMKETKNTSLHTCRENKPLQLVALLASKYFDINYTNLSIVLLSIWCRVCIIIYQLCSDGNVFFLKVICSI